LRSPRVSVVVPTFQRRDLVQEALASIVSQTYRDFEVIVVDDGSTDGTREALAGWGDQIQYSWQPNRGAAAARNTGLELARGELVAFLDSDDLWLPHHLQTALAALARFPEAVLASTAPCRPPVDRPWEEPELVEPYPRLFVEHFVGWIQSCVIARDELVAIGGFDERLRAGEDTDAVMRLGIRGPFVTVPRRTIIKRTSADSLHDRSRVNHEYVRSFLTSAESVVSELERMPGRRELLSAARARREFGRAVLALHEGDERNASQALRAACELFPAYSRAPEWVDKRVRVTTGVQAQPERLAMLAAAARLWPSQDTDTAMYLRGHAIALALWARCPDLAIGLLRDWPLGNTPGFLWRTMPRLGRGAGDWLYHRRHRVRPGRPAHLRSLV
jgi:glycosyltransferase involved in cell wall biosynthesis